jgi:putative transposase
MKTPMSRRSHGLEGRARPPGAPPSAIPVTFPQRTFLPHATPSWVKSDAVFFLTVCCQPRGVNQLCTATAASQLFEAVAFRQRTKRWYIHLLLLMPDHLHGLGFFPPEENIRAVVANFKEITAKRAGIRWQRDFFDHRLRSDESYEEKAHYIPMNPVRQRLVERREDWSYIWEPEVGTAGPAVPPYPGGGPALP